MKYWKRLLSLGIVVVMLFAMIPTGIVTAGGLDLSADEIVISNLNDWNEVASSSESFAGKTVKLANDMNVNNENLPTLFESFAGTFDGQGYKIYNVSATNAILAEKTLSGAVIQNLKVSGLVSNDTEETLAVGCLVAEHDDTAAGTLTISNVSVSGIVRGVSQHVGGLVGALTLRDGQSAMLSHIEMDAQVINQRTDLTHACISAGGVIGIFEPLGCPDLTVREVNMTGEVISTTSSTGGILGSVFSKDSKEDLFAGGNITVSHCNVAGKILSEVENTVQGVGGIVGTFGGFKRDYGEFTAFCGEFNVEHCLISGRIQNINGLTQVMSVGGVLGSMSYHHATVNVNHCLITASFPSHDLQSSNGTGAALILGTSACHKLSHLNVNNTATTHESFVMVGTAIADEENSVVQLVFNGKNCQSMTPSYWIDGRRHSGGITDLSVLAVSQEAATAMVHWNEDEFITRIGGQISVLGVQDNVADDATMSEKQSYAIRLIAIAQTDQIREGRIQVLIRLAETGEVVKTITARAEIVDRLDAYNEDGTLLKTYLAEDFDAKEFVSIVIKGPMGGSEYLFEITPEFTSQDQVTVKGDTVSVSYDARGQYDKEKESIDVTVEPSTPTVRVMSSNILIADAQVYQLDGVHNATGEVYDPTKDDGRNSTVIYKDGLNYHWYFRDDQTGEYLGREDGQPGFTHEQRMQYMAEMFAVYQPDFVGLQEVYGSTIVNGVKTINMQKTILSYLEDRYAYVDYMSKNVYMTNFYTPILYRKDKWKLLDKDIANDRGTEYANDMHRWQWALFESLENPDYKFIVMNLHGPNNNPGETLKEFQPTFFASVNAQLKMLEAQYPDVPIAVTGDFNQKKNSTMLTTMLNGTKLSNTVDQTTDREVTASGIDYIFFTGDRATTLQTRVVDNKTLRKCSDHWAIYSDFRLAKKK